MLNRHSSMAASQYDEITSLAAVSLRSDDRRETTICFDAISNTSSTVVIDESSACWDTFAGAAYRVVNSIVLDFFIILASLLSLVMLIIGLKSLTSCPVEPNIPIYLAVEGSFSLVELLSLQWRRRKKSRGETGSIGGRVDSSDMVSTTFTDIVVVAFLWAWLACGTYWTARVYKPLFVPTPDDPTRWCAETVYVLALVQISMCYGSLMTAVAVALLLLFCHVCRATM